MNTMRVSSVSGFVSPLAPHLTRFLAMKYAMGYRYRDETRALHDLDHFLNTHLSPVDPLITPAIANEYVARRCSESETTRAHRLTLIREVCRFLRLEDTRVVIPDRRSLRIVRWKFVPRVLSKEEGIRFLQACSKLPPGQSSPIRAAVIGPALRLLYLTGLRAGELLRLTQGDFDVEAATLLIRRSKFGKSRVVPIAPDLVQHLVRCRLAVSERYGPSVPDMPLFPSPRGGQYSLSALSGAFHQALKIAGINRIRLHSLRHSFAVLRLLLWCEQNADLGAKLPLLATYLGHVGLASSQRYLQLTQELTGEITRRHQARFGYLIQEGDR
jgi:integrase/recombinase XerD